MPDVRYVILSDLHFGAENSVLTAVTPELIVPDPTTNAPVLLALVKCLRHLVRKNEGSRRPTLVLGGDMLELALALDNVAAMVFEHFVGLTLVGRDPLFAPTIYFVPGNHDHHLWEGARGTSDLADALDEVIGRMTRWIWPLLDQLDEDGGFDG